MVLKYFNLKEKKDFGNRVLVDIASGPIGILTKFRSRGRIAVVPLPIDGINKTIKRIRAPGSGYSILCSALKKDA